MSQGVTEKSVSYLQFIMLYFRDIDGMLAMHNDTNMVEVSYFGTTFDILII